MPNDPMLILIVFILLGLPISIIIFVRYLFRACENPKRCDQCQRRWLCTNQPCEE